MAVHKQFQELWFGHAASFLPPVGHRMVSFLPGCMTIPRDTQIAEPHRRNSFANLRRHSSPAIKPGPMASTQRVDASPHRRLRRTTPKIVAFGILSGTARRALFPPDSIGWQAVIPPDRSLSRNEDVESCTDVCESSEVEDCDGEVCCRGHDTLPGTRPAAAGLSFRDSQ